MKTLNRTFISTVGIGMGLSLLGAVACGTSNDPGNPGAGGTAQVGGDGNVGSGGAGPGAGGLVNGAGGNVNGTGGDTPGGGGAPGVGGDGGGGAAAGGNGNTGGSGAGGEIGVGGSGTTEGEPIPKPKLITSAAGAFWKTDVEPTLGGTNATITVNTNSERQTWLGWGGTFNEVGWRELMKLDAAERERVMKLLFSRAEGLALTWGRIPIGASDYAVDRYTLCDAPCNETNVDTAFSIDRDKDPQKGLIPYIKAAQAVVEAEKATYKGIRGITFWASPWTPPPWSKNNNAYDKGVVKNETANRKALAKYFVKFVQEYGKEGVKVDHIMPQNEPGWAQAYPSAAWGPYTDGENTNTSTPAFLGSFVEQDLRPALNEAGLNDVGIWFGTFSNSTHFNAYWNSLSDKSVVRGAGLQWETVKNIDAPLQAGMVALQTEHRCGNYPWLGNNGMTSTAMSAEAADEKTFWKDWAPNNYNYAVESWKLFKEWITAGVSMYSAWNMVLDRVGRNLDEARPWPQNALISFEENGAVKVTPYYYAFRHLTQYVEPGAKRLDTQGGDALAFKNPDGSIVVAMFNSGNAAQTTLSIGGTMLQFTIPQRGFATVNYTPGE
jgi:glucosylceramidase